MYHHTKLDSLISIVNSRKLWMTDYRFLNDSHEYEKGLQFLTEALKDFSDYPCNTPSEIIDSIKDQIYFTSMIVLGDGDLGRSVFVSSLCNSFDSLTQWITYGSFAIRFNRDGLLRCIRESRDFELLDCKYYESEAHGLAIAASIVREKIIPEAIEYRMGHTDFDDPSYMIDSIIKCSLIFKSSSFKHENETRIVALKNTGFVSEVKVRCSGELLIPYIEFCFDSMVIEEIMVGPSSDQERLLSSLSIFSSNLNNNWRVYSENKEEDKHKYNITINHSKIPYRG